MPIELWEALHSVCREAGEDDQQEVDGPFNPNAHPECMDALLGWAEQWLDRQSQTRSARRPASLQPHSKVVWHYMEGQRKIVRQLAEELSRRLDLIEQEDAEAET